MKLKIAFIALIVSILVITFVGCGNNAPQTIPSKMVDFTIEVVSLNGEIDTIVYRGQEGTTFQIDSSRNTTWLSAVYEPTASHTTIDVGVKGFCVIGKRVR